MRALRMCGLPQLNPSVNGLDHGRTIVYFDRASQGKCAALPCQANNIKIWSHYDNKAGQFSNSLYQRRNPLLRRRQALRSMAMEKMEITPEDMFQEGQSFRQEEMFLGKEFPGVSETSGDQPGPNVRPVGAEFQEVWDLWQRMGMPVEAIAMQRHMTEIGVFFCIFACVQNNYTVDWYELCKEAKFTLEIAKKLIQATEKFVSSTNGAPVNIGGLRNHLPADVSEVIFGLFVTMLVRGLPFDTIKEISFQKRTSQPAMEWGQSASEWGEFYADEERFPVEVTENNVMQWFKEKDGVSSPYADEERFPVEVIESNLLQWFKEKNGASMIEIALKFRECNDLELMRLILKLEQEGKIFWRQGIFRVRA